MSYTRNQRKTKVVGVVDLGFSAETFTTDRRPPTLAMSIAGGDHPASGPLRQSCPDLKVKRRVGRGEP